MKRFRILKSGASYEVSARVSRGDAFLDPTGEKSIFLQVLARAKKKYSFRIKSFSIMNDRIYLVIQPDKGESLSKIMQWVLGVYAQGWNRRHKTYGHFWAERFFSRVLEGVKEVIDALKYVERRAVEAGLVKLPWEWEYGGLWQRMNRGVFYNLLL